MRLSCLCPSCNQRLQADVSPQSPVLECRCGWKKRVADQDLSDSPTRCLVCENADLWRQKDFPQSLGIAAIGLQIVLSTTFWYFHKPLWTYGTLMVFAIADLVLFTVMPDVLVCYRCRARHRISAAHDAHGTFDHETAERYRQERLRASAR